mmetsp:Transcript_16006/g.31267  ORF Transcript_16006/g.31267 Transcript_16006/m.31267 type:complete len:439 (-) Transcript_16006:71-1387(-)|eukprot:CAMPEP_0172683226 /NCGR_PEP_ID=MMETSP1074-20121228/18708_1 /TAXON_ID=2916 /ORGANISM="Ceratium fusus, Strain PA161109" /LENGTH=438 /DNA_ID=CAMNT_0013502045 /DNA_START=72 /DNA_END=1388 /DNA_ORIENTATION=-
MHAPLWKNAVFLSTLNYSFFVLHVAHPSDNLIRRDKRNERSGGRRRRTAEPQVHRREHSTRHHAKLQVAPSGEISDLERRDNEEGPLDHDNSQEQHQRWRQEILEQRQRQQRDNLEQRHASHGQSQHCTHGRSIEARFRFQNPQQLMMLEISRASVDVARRLVSAGLTPDQVTRYDNTGHLDGWEGPDFRIVSQGREMPLKSFEDVASIAQVHNLFPLVVAWRFHCVMKEFPIVNSREVSFGENSHHARKGRIPFFKKLFARRRAPAPVPPGHPTPAPKKGFFHSVGNFFKSGWNKVKSAGKKLWKGVKNTVNKTFHKVVKSVTTGDFNSIGPIVTGGFEEIKTETAKTVEEAKTIAVNTTSNLVTLAAALKAKVETGALNATKGVDQMLELATKAVTNLGMGIAATGQKEKDTVTALASKEGSVLNRLLNGTNIAGR